MRLLEERTIHIWRCEMWKEQFIFASSTVVCHPNLQDMDLIISFAVSWSECHFGRRQPSDKLQMDQGRDGFRRKHLCEVLSYSAMPT